MVAILTERAAAAEIRMMIVLIPYPSNALWAIQWIDDVDGGQCAEDCSVIFAILLVASQRKINCIPGRLTI